MLYCAEIIHICEVSNGSFVRLDSIQQKNKLRNGFYYKGLGK